VERHGFAQEWLHIEGFDSDDVWDTENFVANILDSPREWAADIVHDSSKVVLHVGDKCSCNFTGLAVYSKRDSTTWLRLQFDFCTGCRSTAKHAAVAIPLRPADAGSPLFSWMCTLDASSPSCQAAMRHEKLATTTTTEAASTTVTLTSTRTTSTSTITTTTPNPECTFLTVHLETESLGYGQCDGTAILPKGQKVKNRDHCFISCQLLWIEQDLLYSGAHEMNRHLDTINMQKSVCKGYAFNEKSNLCKIYMGHPVNSTINSTDHDWECHGHVKAPANAYQMHIDRSSSMCTTNMPITTTTVTSTTITSTTTTTETTSTTTTTFTTTKHTEKLLFSEFLGLPEREDARVFDFPGDVHYRRKGLEATILQLQSSCYEAVDYYMLGTWLPVQSSQWESLRLLLAETEGTQASRPPPCSASVAVERIPLDLGRPRQLSAGLSSAGVVFTALFSVTVASLLGLCGIVGAWQILTRGGQAARSCATHATGLTAAAVALGLVYCMNLGAGWLVSRAGLNELSNSGDGGLLLLTPHLLRNSLPAAGSACGFVLAMWFWPSSTGSQRGNFQSVPNYELAPPAASAPSAPASATRSSPHSRTSDGGPGF